MYLNIFNYVDITIFHTYFFLFYYALIVDSTFYDIMLHVAKTCIWIWIQLYLIENYKFHAPPLTPFTKNGSKNTIKKTGNGNRIIRAYLHGFLFCQWNMRSLKEKSGSNIWYSDYLTVDSTIFDSHAKSCLTNPPFNQLFQRTRGQRDSGPLEQ